MLRVAYNCVVPRFCFLILGGLSGIWSLSPLLGQDTEEQRARLVTLVESMDQVAEVARAYFKEIPRESFQIAPVLEQTQGDPEALRAWVAENILLVPYSGVLRGPGGTLMDRSGNSLDRAILLAVMLKEAGHEPTLLRTTLSESQVHEHLWQPVLNQDLAYLREQVSPAEAGQVPENLTGEAYDKSMARLLEYEQRLENVLMRTDHQMPLLMQQLERLGQGSSEEQQRVEWLRDHWWVKIGGEEGTDLDPALHGVEGIHDHPELNTTLAEIPDELYHTVTARVVIEQWDQGKLNEKVALEQSWRAADIANQVVVFSILPTDGLSDLDVLNEQEEVLNAQIREELVSKRSWVPALSMGRNDYSDKAFNANGELENPNESGQSKAFGRAISMLGALGGEEKPEGELTGVWQEWILERPDGMKRVQRRVLVDWIGEENRRNGNIPEARPQPGEQALLERSLALMNRGTGIVLTGEVSRPYMLARAAVSLINSKDAYKEIITAELERDSAKLEKGLSNVETFPEELFSWAVLRHELNSMRSKVYLEEPNLILQQHQFSTTANPDKGMLHSGVDLVFNRVAVLSTDGGESRMARLEQGVIDAALESVLMETGEASAISTSNLYQQTDPRQWQQVTTLEELDTRYHGLSESVRELMRIALNEGAVLLMPPDWAKIPDSQLCWWELDESGHLLGRGALGWGQSGQEYLINLYVAKAAIMALVLGHQTCTGSSVGCWICTAIGGALIALAVFTTGGIAVVGAATIAGSTGGAIATLICSVAI